MKKNLAVLCALLCLCFYFAACESQLPTGLTGTLSDGTNNISANDPVSSSDIDMKKSLHASSVLFVPSGNDLNSGSVDPDLRVYVEEAYNSIILFDILGEDAVIDYGENIRKHMSMRDMIQSPGLYDMIHHFNISQKDLLETSDTGFYGTQYNKDLLRTMYLPYEDMLAVTMNAKGAYLNGTVYNIQTLNELFENDKKAFSRISLDELAAYQERLEGEGIDYGFSQDMVDFANQNCPTAIKKVIQ